MHVTTPDNQSIADFPTLTVIAFAAHKAGDRPLLRFARDKLLRQHGVRITFTPRPIYPASVRGEVTR